VTYICNPSPREADAGGLLPSVQEHCGYQKKTLFQRKEGRKEGRTFISLKKKILVAY